MFGGRSGVLSGIRGSGHGGGKGFPDAGFREPGRGLLSARRRHGRRDPEDGGRFPLRRGIHRGLGRKQPSRRQRRFGHGDGDGKRRLQRRRGEKTLREEIRHCFPLPDVSGASAPRDDRPERDQEDRRPQGKEGFHRCSGQRLLDDVQDHPRRGGLQSREGSEDREPFADGIGPGPQGRGHRRHVLQLRLSGFRGDGPGGDPGYRPGAD